MSEWNIPKIREECLKLMGWKYDEDMFLGSWLKPGADPANRSNYVLDFKLDDLPDPTTSLDDALSLMEKYRINLHFHPRFDPQWSAVGTRLVDHKESWMGCQAETAAMAVCIAALRCEKHPLVANYGSDVLRLLKEQHESITSRPGYLPELD